MTQGRLANALELSRLVATGQKAGRLMAMQAQQEILNELQVPPSAPATMDFTTVADPSLGIKEKALMAAGRTTLALERILVALAKAQVILGVNNDLLSCIIEAKNLLRAAGVEPARLASDDLLRIRTTLKG
jgi:hypothetical protein